MRAGRRTAAWIAGLALAAAAVAPAQEAVARGRIEAALAAVRPALVKLTVISLDFADGRAVRYPSSGSGVVVTADGHVLTNYHVAGRSARIQATLADGTVVDAEVVTHDPLSDLSVLKLAAGSPPVPAASFAAEPPQVGDPVLALGSPLTLTSSVTLGIVSNTRRVFTDFVGTRIEELDLGGEPTGLFTQWIQHDALILPGNSGGPLVDLAGRIVGINELGGSGVGFAIPAAIARQVLEAALADGRVRRADLGFGVLPVAKLGREQGALIASVAPDSPAARAGVEPGEILLAVAGAPVEVRFFEQVPELYRAIAELPIGAEVELELERPDGGRRRVLATTVELEAAAGAEAEVPALGVTVQELTTVMARERQLPPRSGLVVTSLRAGGGAADARPPVQPGDLLTAVDGAVVTTIAALEAALAAAGDQDRLLLELRRDDERLLSIARRDGARQLRSGGELPKAWLGVETQVLTEALAAAVESPGLRGFRVTHVLPWSAAEEGGIEVGDVVVSLDGEPLEAEREQDVDNLRRAIEELAIGDRATLGVVREGRRLELPLTLEARPRSASEARTTRHEKLGFAARDLTLFDRVEFHWGRDQQGALVTEVVPGGWAQMAGLLPNDLVIAVDGRETPDTRELEDELAARVAARPEVVTLFLRRGARTHFVFLEPEWNGASTSDGEP